MSEVVDHAQRDGGAPSPHQDAGHWEGPLDLLLAEVRARRIDLSVISMSELVARCLDALPGLPTLSKADQISWAAELTELKSRLLLPQAADEAGDEALRLRRQLEHLILIRQAGEALIARDQLGRDMFARGMPEMEPEPDPAATRPDLDLMDLIKAYARLRLHSEVDAPLALRRILVMSMREALARLGGRLAELEDWTNLFGLVKGEGSARSVVAASLMAALELARQGEVEIRQDETGAGVWVRKR